jgi:hypothetical protein
MGPFSLDLELVYEDALLFLENGRAENVWAAAERHHGTPYDVIEANYKYQMWVQLKIKENRNQIEDIEFRELDDQKDEFSKPLLGADTEGGSKLVANRFFIPFLVEELLESIPPEALVIYTAISDQGVIILAIDQTGIKFGGWSKELNSVVLRSIALAYLDALKGGKGIVGDPVIFHHIDSLLSRVLISPRVEQCIMASSKLTGETPLPMGGIEAIEIGKLADAKVLDAKNTTRAQFLSESACNQASQTRKLNDDGVNSAGQSSTGRWRKVWIVLRRCMAGD